LGIKALPEALTLARQLDLDLVEVAPMANPPVCRIMDYGKFRYEESQKAKESRKKTIQVSIKEVKFRPKIGKGDFDTKVRHMQDFLQDGHKVKVTLQFRGREMAHPELGSKILDSVIEQLGPLAKVEAYARLEGRNMTMVLAPEKKIVAKKEREHRDKDAKDPSETTPSETTPAESTPAAATTAAQPQPSTAADVADVVEVAEVAEVADATGAESAPAAE
jgi:translation initiation factor IF-3